MKKKIIFLFVLFFFFWLIKYSTLYFRERIQKFSMFLLSVCVYEYVSILFGYLSLRNTLVAGCAGLFMQNGKGR